MATTSRLWGHLRRTRLCSSSLSHFSPRNPRPLPSPLSNPRSSSLSFLQFNPRFSSSSPSPSDDGFDFQRLYDSTAVHDVNHAGISDASEGVSSAVTGAESALPVKVVISLLDGYHELTGLPWWIVIASSTLAMRVVLFPVLILQLKKLKRISELLPKLPSPLPPPFSGRSYINHLSLFWRERRAIGCPSFLWFLAFFSVQVPCFLLWMTSIRRMSLDCHPGFDCGGILWFENLSELPHGILGQIFPLLIAVLHYVNVQISFSRTAVHQVSSMFGLLAKFYKHYLDFLAIPIFFIGSSIPQGSLVYWVTNASLTLLQQLSLKHPVVRLKLGLPEDSPKAFKNEETAASDTPLNSSVVERTVPEENLSPKELHALSVVLISKGQQYQAIPLLELAIEKDPECVPAMVVLGQTLLQIGELEEASEHLECAISKIFLADNLTEAEYSDLLVVASQWAGVAYVKLGKHAEGIRHLERIPCLNEPDEPKKKAHYYDGLILLASALFNEGRKAEAAKYLQLVVAYDSSYNYLLEQCEKDDDNLLGDLVKSRRADY